MFDAALRTILAKFTLLSSYLKGVYTTWDYLVSAGLVAGKERLYILGSNSACGAAPGEPLWPVSGAYTWQTADQTLKVSSSSANDDAAPAGTGAWTVRVWYLNAAGVEFTVDVVMNGVGLVVTGAGNARRVNRIAVLTAGSTGYNEGVIVVYATDGVTPMCRMDAGLSVSNTAIQTVPAGKRDVICVWGTMGEAASAGSMFFIRYRTSPTAPWLSIGGFGVSENSRDVLFDVPLRFEAGTDYYVLGITGDLHTDLRGWREAA